MQVWLKCPVCVCSQWQKSEKWIRELVAKPGWLCTVCSRLMPEKRAFYPSRPWQPLGAPRQQTPRSQREVRLRVRCHARGWLASMAIKRRKGHVNRRHRPRNGPRSQRHRVGCATGCQALFKRKTASALYWRLCLLCFL